MGDEAAMIRALALGAVIAAVAYAAVEDITAPENVLIEESCSKDPNCKPPTFEDGECKLDVAKCLATPSVGPKPVWHQPVINFGSTYSDLCASESFVKKKQEKVTKSAEKNMKEAAIKDKYAEKKAKGLENKLKKSHEGMVKMATKVQESDHKTSAKVIYNKVQVKAPAQAVKYEKMPKVEPEAAPVVVANTTKYSCDQSTCKCVEDKQGHSKDFCEQMCSTGPCAYPKIPPFVPEKEKKPEKPVEEKIVHRGQEKQVKAVLATKEAVEKTAEKNKKVRCEVEQKETEKMQKVLGNEIASKKKESIQKYTVMVPKHKVEGPLADFEQGTKKTKELLAKFGACKEKAVKQKIESKEKKEMHAKERSKKKCRRAHRTCLEIHAASAAKDALAAKQVAEHTTQLKADCGKTLAYEEKVADTMRYNICTAAAQKMKALVGELRKSFTTENLFRFNMGQQYAEGKDAFNKFNKAVWNNDEFNPEDCDKPKAPAAVAKKE